MESIFGCRVRFVLAGAICLAGLRPNLTYAQQATPPVDSYTWNNRPPDPRFKADILLVVAHPDDEVMAAAYMAREIFDHQERVAVVFQNPGDGGNNEVGQATPSTQAPEGWKLHPAPPASVEPRSEYYVRVQADAPATRLPGWQQFTVSATSDHQSIGSVPIRIELSSGWVAPQQQVMMERYSL
jgi:hypothetical protein